jgi:hypothetical protein
MKKYIGYFIGPHKIKNLVKSKRSTYLDNDVVCIEYEDGTKEERPLEILEKIAAKETYDLSTLRDKIGKIVVEKILSVLLEAEVKVEDVDFILQLIAASLNQNMEKATEILWKKKLHERTVADIQGIFNSDKKDAK